jgi:hypothetical protein
LLLLAAAAAALLLLLALDGLCRTSASASPSSTSQ